MGKLINPDKMMAFSALFIFQHATEHAIAVVQGRLPKPQALCHSAHIEILHRNQVILIGYLRRLFVKVILALVGSMPGEFRHSTFLLLTVL